jgi:hypothetical protein
MGLILGFFSVFTFYIMFTRPYRCQFSNLLIFILSCIFVVDSFVLLLKISGLKSALFVDNYFFGLLILINGFGWFLVVAFLGLMIAVKGKWSLDKEQVLQAINGQELTIVYIKRARKFRKKIINSKVYGEPEKLEMNHLLEMLTDEFNKLRDKEAITMDALLEVLDQLKDMKKK